MMSYRQLFRSKKLLLLYEEGKLKPVFDQFENDLVVSKLLGAGGDASGFLRTSGDVLKICSKQVNYFRHFNRNASDFKEHINSLTSFFVPIKEILYEDGNVVVYTQDYCRPLNKKQIDAKIVVSIFQFVKYMIQNNILLTDLSPHNFGFRDNRLMIFDYHGLFRFRQNGQLTEETWWKRVVHNLITYMSCAFDRQNLKKYRSMMEQFNVSDIHQKLKDDYRLPLVFLQFFEYLIAQSNRISEVKVIEHLDSCIGTIKKY